MRRLYGSWIKRIALVLRSRIPWADLDELLQWGAIGMLEAAEKFDAEQGVPFEAYAIRRVRGAMLNGLRGEGRRRRGETLFDIDVVDSAALANGGSPDDPFSLMTRSENHAALTEALSGLPELEYRVLALHYYDEMNNREIAAILEISEGYASRLRKRALDLLARRMSAHCNGAIV
ncbi:MAG: RNA polymerase subunit sigma [Rhodospirillales bacterium 20-64-7]|nr:MAG: RNA polymerase subunit sigma [Rhodospirillales bacterium 20-64-7]